jgi:phosphoglycolate phosphatase-like HAD superfamily hydrolase
MKNNAQKIKCFDNVLEIISKIKVKKIIVTSAYSGGIKKILKDRISIFDEIHGREEDKKSIILKSICKGDEIYLTDSCRDIKICKDINISVIGVGWGYETSDEIIKSSPDYFVNSHIELKKLLKKLKLV